MSRPRSEDPKRPLSVSIRSSTLDSVSAAAVREGYSSPGLFVADTIERAYGPPPPGEDCEHPMPKERQVLHAVFCGLCGRRLR